MLHTLIHTVYWRQHLARRNYREMQEWIAEEMLIAESKLNYLITIQHGY